ncbi:MAG: hypothetical protein A2233_02745 [Candidatus Kerfeldbacteria bacterium RIFOXYA2_FULL_38_24]|uniref:Transcription regulator TrmB N-terminal domain-containing protein n=1 Tax=Candidatus Kerfeldbacteria bacterium RIFOXYB2_FULL_38_14 TaxID=1798547 RepID=A0A1G2BFP9_9BACT|nr:MAG: hypothetical protein A2233_02745 [Candidatus Kerfeldbacteria bacterium RIFOXYA2_FULL_38_24]OGY87100.1 MAG: hypothetical protein A2319_02755 [Candidatus Kerfeldbacteria bacterium RIFOXYB2_FULL_38_14]OGY88528.1 MAG: hypothetical protein A2458_05245 [Candidatus Kerfeldbacteria bacterium RIFOXYC2_FULL_38_9]
MKNDRLIEVLTELGLSENESKVYFSALSLGANTILKIAKDANLKRSTVYSIIEALKQQGLMHVQMHGLKKKYVAAHPTQLEQMIEKKRNDFKKHLPEFLATYHLDGKESTVKYYEGLKAVQSLYDESVQRIKSHEDYLVITNQEQWLQLDERFFMNYIKKRAKLNIRTRLLFQDSPTARKHKKLEKNFNETVKILPTGTTLETDMILIPSMLIIHQLVPPIMAIVIENKSIINMQKELFEIIWKLLK